MLEPCLFKRGTVLGIILLFIFGCCMPGFTGTSIMKRNQQISFTGGTDEAAEKTVVTCVAFGKPHNSKQTTTLSQDDISMIFELLQELKSEMILHPFSEKTQSLKRTFVDLLDEKELIPNGVSKEAYLSLLNPRWIERVQKTTNKSSSPQPLASHVTCSFCSVGGEGVGVLIPLFQLPRPRLFMQWTASDAYTTAANLFTSKGYIAGGAQTGFTFGFMGIGMCYAIPGYTVYGFIGYALHASTTAEYIELYPPNRAPEIYDINPADTEQNVPLSTSELQFSIQDADGDLMSYSVTTEPDIGSASGNLKPFGVYKVPISGLHDFTNYTWHVVVTDGKDTTEGTFTFTTEAIAPIISNPSPADGERDVPMDISYLQFILEDFQGDAIDYTVETSPNIGSKHETGVYDGTYTVPISAVTYGLTYRWYVNATDGTHWARKIFSFETGYPSQFNPFEFGWRYRKQITIHHTLVVDILEDYTLFISTIDPNLMKAQNDGDDILFMSGPGTAKRQYHEIETFNQITGKLVAWVNIPTLSPSQDTIFYMYYGNPTCTNQQNPEKTWNSHYQAVWHLNNIPTGVIIDSTSYDNDGTSHGGMATSQLMDGKTGKCLDFDGTDDYISVPDSSSLKPTDITLVAWFCPQDRNLPEGSIVAKSCYDYWSNADGHTYGFYLHPNQTMDGRFEINAYEQFDVMGAYPITTDTWYYLTLTFDRSTGIGKFYVNGVLAGTKNCNSEVLWYNNPWDFVMAGCRFGGGHEQVINTFFNCRLDEVRVSNTPLSVGWIATEYANQNNPTSFLNIGPEEPHP